ncbi:MAG: hypothetical protein ACLFWL_10490 [Candidatus Brocadiia bacterium]
MASTVTDARPFFPEDWIILLVLALPILSFAGCGGEYSTSGTSEKEIKQVTSAVEAYFAEAKGASASEKKRMPAWLHGAEKPRVKNVEKMNGRYKALVEIGFAGKTLSHYFILEDKDGELQVTGVI